MVVWIWVLIPLAGILLAGFSEYLKFKQKASQLGTSTDVLERQVEALTGELRTLLRERQDLVERVQNLETIVTSEAWDALDRGAAPLIDLDAGASTEETAEEAAGEAARLARRLRTRP